MRKKCILCDNPRKRHAKKYCEYHQKEKSRERRNYTPLKYCECGQIMMARSNSKKYCESCKRKRDYFSQNMTAARRSGKPDFRMSKGDLCDCGVIYTKRGTQNACPSCAQKKIEAHSRRLQEIDHWRTVNFNSLNDKEQLDAIQEAAFEILRGGLT